MILKTLIKNFQSHKHTLLEFHKGMNVIVGDSDSGKSAIIRALNFAIKNKPSGDIFRSIWGGNTSVRIETKENTIIRTKTKSENKYELNKLDPFKAFKTDVPEEIEKALQMDDINIHQQHDPFFLISDTPGKVATHFNKIAKLDKIDKGLFKIQHGEKDTKTGKVLFTGINILKSDISYIEKEIVDKKEQLKEFVDLHQFEIDLMNLEELQTVTDQLKTDTEQLSSLIFSYEQLADKIKTKSKVLSMEDSISSILQLYEKKRESKQNYKTIKKLSLKIHYSQEDIKEAEKEILAESAINKILKVYQEHKKTQLSLTQLTKLCSNIQLIIKAQETASKQLKKLETEYKRDFPEICPLCETKIK